MGGWVGGGCVGGWVARGWVGGGCVGGWVSEYNPISAGTSPRAQLF